MSVNTGDLADSVDFHVGRRGLRKNAQTHCVLLDVLVFTLPDACR